MAVDDSITHWIEGAKQGEEKAYNALWERYYDRLVRFARGKLANNRRRAADEEDVAQSAFKSFCLAARGGRFPDLKDREGLWKLLLKLTARKAVDLMRYNNRQKRRVLGESVLISPGDDAEGQGLARVIGDEPTPEFAAMVTDEFRRLIEVLGENELRKVALLKLEGLGNEEMASRLGCSLRTVERQLQLIRKKWEVEIGRGIES